jgi:hypothetical protein
MANILLSDIVTRVQNLLGTDAQLSDAEVRSMAIARYEHLHDANPWSKRRKEFTINTRAVSANAAAHTATLTLGSSSVVFAGAAMSSNLDGLQIRFSGEPQYYVVSFNTTTTISLKDGNGTTITWPRATNAAASWTLFQTFYALPSDCDIVLDLAHDYPLSEFDGGREALDRYDPSRESTASDPTHWISAGINSSNARLIEIWPVPSQAMTLRGQYLIEAPQITATSTINIHPAVLTYAVAADCYNMLYSKTGDQSQQQLALFYEKKYAETKNDILPYEVAKQSPPTTIQRRRRRPFGKGTDWETDHDTNLTGWLS